MWGASVGEVACRVQYLDAGCQNPVTAAGCPATGTGTGSLFRPTGTRGREVPGRPTWPAVESWIDRLHIHQTRPNVSACMGPWGGSLISALDYKKSRGHASLLLSFCFSPVARVPFRSPLFAHLCPFPLLGGRGRLLTPTSHKCSDPGHPLRTTPSRIPTIRWMNRWSCLPIRNIQTTRFHSLTPATHTTSLRPR